jgi:outer membrane protein OmpA-like peptidoglycan-associated protein
VKTTDRCDVPLKLICVIAVLSVALCGCVQKSPPSDPRSVSANTGKSVRSPTPSPSVHGAPAEPDRQPVASGAPAPPAAFTSSGHTPSEPGAKADLDASRTGNAAPTATAPANLLSMAAGTIIREWPPTAPDIKYIEPFSLIEGYDWMSKDGERGPLIFVFEFAATARIDSLGFQSPAGDQLASLAAQSVRVEASTEGPDAGYSLVGDYALKPSTAEQAYPLSHPVIARWLRVTAQPRSDAKSTSLGQVHAYGKLQLSGPSMPISGPWWIEDHSFSGSRLLEGAGRLAAVPAPELLRSTFYMVHFLQLGNEIAGGWCPNQQNIKYFWRGSQSGNQVAFTYPEQRTGVINSEGNLIVGALPDGSSPFLLMRLAPGSKCLSGDKTVGSGRTVLVLDENGYYTTYYPQHNPTQNPGNRFVHLSIAFFTPEMLTGVDTVVLNQICDFGQKILPPQARALLEFTQAGHKLIIHDADTCTSTDYSFLPFPFHTSNPGAQGQKGDNLILVEPSTLGSDRKGTPQFLDLSAYLADPNNQIGDGNTVTTKDPHWCGHLFGTNVLNVSGFMHMYAQFGQGLLIYNGLDRDASDDPTYQRLLALELQQPVPALLPCTESVAAKFLVAPSEQVPFNAGQARHIEVPLQVLANQGYAGAVSLTATAPADAPWATALSVSQVTLKGDTAPVTLSIDIPGGTVPGGHQFLVVGDDGQGNTATATITLVAAAAPLIEKVESVTNGCTAQLTLGSDALFAFGEATLTKSAQKTLAGLGPAIKKVGNHPLKVNGYTDSIGSDNYNDLLSEQRARAVRDWLASHHYVPATTPIQGFGKKEPATSNTNPDGSDDPAGRAKNRRVEVLIDTCK